MLSATILLTKFLPVPVHPCKESARGFLALVLFKKPLTAFTTTLLTKCCPNSFLSKFCCRAAWRDHTVSGGERAGRGLTPPAVAAASPGQGPKGPAGAAAHGKAQRALPGSRSRRCPGALPPPPLSPSRSRTGGGARVVPLQAALPEVAVEPRVGDEAGEGRGSGARDGESHADGLHGTGRREERQQHQRQGRPQRAPPQLHCPPGPAARQPLPPLGAVSAAAMAAAERGGAGAERRPPCWGGNGRGQR